MNVTSINFFCMIIVLCIAHGRMDGMTLLRLRTQAAKLPQYGTTIKNPRTYQKKLSTKVFDQKNLNLAVPIPNNPALSKTTITPPHNTSSPSLLARVTNRVQALWQGLWHRAKAKSTQNVFGKTTDDMMEEIKNKPLKALISLDPYIINHSKDDIDEILDRLIITGEHDKSNGIQFLEVFATKCALYPQRDTPIITEKIVDWASWRLMDLLCKTSSTHEIIRYLLSFDTDKKLASAIAEKYEDIKRTKEGSRFMDSVMQKQQEKNDHAQQPPQNWTKKITNTLSEKWKTVLSTMEQNYNIKTPSVFNKKSPQQWGKELDASREELRQRINARQSLQGVQTIIE